MDAFFCEGSRMIFQLTLTILAKCEAYVSNCVDEGDAMMKLSNYFKNINRSSLYDEEFNAEIVESMESSSDEPISISRLIYEAQSLYPNITRTGIERLRLHHRLKVVQGLEDSTMKNVLRSVKDECPNLSEEELKLLFAIVKNEQLQRQQRLCHNKQSLEAILHSSGSMDNPSTPYHEMYKADFDTFNALHTHLSLWGGSEGDTSVILAERMFRLMDSNRDGFLNFRELVQTFNALCKGDHVLKLRLFYCLHLPGVVLPGELEHLNKPHLDEVDNGGGADEACDAEHFFDVANRGLDEVAEQIKDDEELDTNTRLHTEDATSLRSLHRRLFFVPNPGDKKKSMGPKLPQLPRDNFVLLWKSLHDLVEFGNLDDTTMEGRQAMYHSISVMGTLLLQIGEVGQRVKDAHQQVMRSRSVEYDDLQAPDEDDLLAANPISYSSYDLASVLKKEDKLKSHQEWSVTFEQFLASAMNEGCLVDYFDHKMDVVAKLKQFGDSKMKRQDSVQVSGSRSVFYA